VSSNSTRGDDDQEEKGNQACDAVQNTHSNCRIVPALLTVLILVRSSEIAGDGRSRSASGIGGEVSQLGGGYGVRHGHNSLEVQILARETAALALLAVQKNSLGLRVVAHERVQDGVGGDI